MTRILSLFVMFMLCGVVAFSQNRVVTGTVSDEKGAPVEGASVSVVGKTAGTAADQYGNFRLSVAPNAVIRVSGTGITAKDVNVGTEATSFPIVVKRAAGTELTTVTVGAFGLRKKSEAVGYATGRVDNASITNGKATNIGEALSGRVSGLTISNNNSAIGSTPRIVLRGLRSISGDNTALIVLDGVAVPANTINFINPNDVDRIDVLKGGQAATLFGSDGVNGAIVITTKKGVVRKPEVSISTSLNIEKIAYLPRFQHQFGSGSGYGIVPEETYFPGENQQYGDAYDGSTRAVGRAIADGSILMAPYKDLNNRASLFNTGYTRQTDFSYRAGDATSNMLLSVQNLNTAGIIPKDKTDRTVMRFSASKTYNKISVSFDGNYSFTKTKTTNSDYYGNILNVAGWIPINDLRDWQTNKFADPNGYYNDYYNNPFWELDNNRDLDKQNNFQGNLKFNFKATEALSFTVRFGVSNTTDNFTRANNLYRWSTFAQTNAYLNGFNSDYGTYIVGKGRNLGIAASNLPGGLLEQTASSQRYNMDAFANYKKTFGNISVEAIAGMPIQIRQSKTTSAATSAVLFDLNTIGVPSLTQNSFTGLYTANNNTTYRRKISAFADLTLGFKEMVYLHGSARTDYTSVFNDATIGYTKPHYETYGGDVSFVVSNMLPQIKGKVVDNLKIRASYNRNGNDNTGEYNLKQVYNTGTGFPYNGLPGTTIGNTVPSPTLIPEVVKSGEVGLELGLFKNRITLEGSIYRQTSDEQLLTATVSSASGFSAYRLNAAKMVNNGYEIDAKAVVYESRNKDLRIMANANFSYNKNKIQELYGQTNLNNIEFAELSGLAHPQASVNATVGQSFPYLKVTSFVRDAQGRIIVDSVTGWPSLNATRTGAGGTLPKYQVGTGLTVNFKNLTLSANAEYRGGYVVYHALGEDMSFTGSGAVTAIYDRQQFIWPNSVTTVNGKLVPNTNVAANYYYTSYYQGDASAAASIQKTGEMFYSSGDFWKLRDVSLSYNFPSNLFAKSRTIKGCTLTFFGRNLFTILAKDNWYGDPELSATTQDGPNNVNAQGISDSFNTPTTRQLGGSLKFTF